MRGPVADELTPEPQHVWRLTIEVQGPREWFALDGEYLNFMAKPSMEGLVKFAGYGAKCVNVQMGRVDG